MLTENFLALKDHLGKSRNQQKGNYYSTHITSLLLITSGVGNVPSAGCVRPVKSFGLTLPRKVQVGPESQ